MKRYRIEVDGAQDRNLIAVFVRAADPQAALAWAQKRVGFAKKFSVTQDE